VGRRAIVLEYKIISLSARRDILPPTLTINNKTAGSRTDLRLFFDEVQAAAAPVARSKPKLTP